MLTCDWRKIIYIIPNQERKHKKTIDLDSKIVNVSKQDHNKDEIQLLRSTLKFTPTPTINHQELK